MAEFALPCLPYLDSIVINELEAGALTGLDAPVPGADGPVDWPALEAMALRPDRAGVARARRRALPGRLRRGRAGRADVAAGLGAGAREEVRSTTGAGDAFAAGVIFGLHDGWPVDRCLRLAVASAAACVRSPDTSGGIRPADACLAEADALGYRPADALA